MQFLEDGGNFGSLGAVVVGNAYVKGFALFYCIVKGKGSTWIGNELTEERLSCIKKLNEVAQRRGQKLSQLALSWLLHNPAVVTVIIGASKPEQIAENAEAANAPEFTAEELAEIESILRS